MATFIFQRIEFEVDYNEPTDRATDRRLCFVSSGKTVSLTACFSQKKQATFTVNLEKERKREFIGLLLNYVGTIEVSFLFLIRFESFWTRSRNNFHRNLVQLWQLLLLNSISKNAAWTSKQTKPHRGKQDTVVYVKYIFTLISVYCGRLLLFLTVESQFRSTARAYFTFQPN